jgi:hypothetical protein
MRCAVVAFILLAGSLTAQAADLDMAARQMAGLFTQACLSHAGDGAAQRKFLEDHHVPQLPAAGLAVFLQNRPGIGYNASNGSGRLAVTIEIDGVCTVYSDSAAIADVFSALDSMLPLSGMDVSDMRAHDRTPSEHVRDYVLTKDGQRFTLVASTFEGPGTVKAIFSISLRNPSDDAPH